MKRGKKWPIIRQRTTDEKALKPNRTLSKKIPNGSGYSFLNISRLIEGPWGRAKEMVAKKLPKTASNCLFWPFS